MEYGDKLSVSLLHRVKSRIKKMKNVRLEGNWSKNLKDGHFDIFGSHGKKFEGNYENNKKNGYGIKIFPNGEKYTGYWKNNMWEGEGTFINKFWVLHQGSFVKGQLNGVTEVTDKGSKLFVSYENNKPNGIGKYVTRDGNRFEVTFKNGALIKKIEL